MKKEILINLELDETQTPTAMSWNTSDATEGDMPCKAMQLCVWDPKEKSSLRVDLWTKDFYKEEMDLFILQNIMTMADSYERATHKKELADILRTMGKEFGNKAGITYT